MKASVFIATSLDGFIARRDGALESLPAGGGESHGYEEFTAPVDGIVIGRKTFETVPTFEAWPYGRKPVVVLSTRPSSLKAPEGAVCDAMTGAPLGWAIHGGREAVAGYFRSRGAPAGMTEPDPGDR